MTVDAFSRAAASEGGLVVASDGYLRADRPTSDLVMQESRRKAVAEDKAMVTDRRLEVEVEKCSEAEELMSIIKLKARGWMT